MCIKNIGSISELFIFIVNICFCNCFVQDSTKFFMVVIHSGCSTYVSYDVGYWKDARRY